MMMLDILESRLRAQYIPQWFNMFYDVEHGGFHERLNASDNAPLDIGYRRALSQFRQIYIYADSCAMDRKLSHAIGDRLQSAIDNTITNFYNAEIGGWAFRTKTDGTPDKAHYDLYAQAFAIFAMSACYKWTGDQKYIDLADATHRLIDTKFRDSKTGGLTEALDENLKPMPLTRRQNPHMHLCEACLFMFEESGKQRYLDMAGEMIDLLKNKFLDKEQGTLCEFFSDDLQQHPDEGHAYEAGHHFEWVALLERYCSAGRIQDQEINQIMHDLIHWAHHNGFDKKHGGIYNSCDKNGNPIDREKRIWPVAEAVKAYAVATCYGLDEFNPEAKTQELMALLKTSYLSGTHGWNEILGEDLRVESDFLPATTPYHLYLGLVETVKIMSGFRES